VIAFGRGGALETVRGHWADAGGKPDRSCTGVFFRKQTAGDVAEAVRVFSRWHPNPQTIRSHALKFDASVFRKSIMKIAERRERL
jgi:hypothetical protein